MNTVNKPFASIILIIAFTILFGAILPIKTMLYTLSPKIINDYLQAHNYSSDIFKLLMGWLISFVVSIIFVLKSDIVQRLVINWGFKLLKINILLIMGFLFVGLVSLIQSSWLILIVSVLWAYLNLPIKIMIFIGVLKILLSLSTVNSIEEDRETPQWYFVVLVLGFAILLLGLFGGISSIPFVFNNAIANVNFIVVTLSSWIISIAVSFFFVKKANIYERVTASYANKLLILSIFIFVFYFIISSAIGFEYLVSHILIFNLLNLLNLSAVIMLVIAILKILLTLKAPIK